jgi:putative ABC transport system substrate-binding protein
MKRRDFITLLGGAAAAWPLATRAQQPALPVVGYLGATAAEAGAYTVTAFRKGLSEAGYTEGRNVIIDYRWEFEPGDRAQQAEMVAELVRRPVTVIVAGSLNVALVAKAATSIIPIIFNATGDPVATGLVASLNRPGGNVTGVTNLGTELGPKRLGLLHDLVPQGTRFALLVDPVTTFAKSTSEETEAAAAVLGAQVETFNIRTNRDIDEAFAAMVQKRIDAVAVAQAGLFNNRRFQLTTLAVHRRMPTIYPYREFVQVGGLMSYGANRADQLRQVGLYSGRVLKGEKPSDLPVVQPTKFELVINLQTAHTLGIEFPPRLLALADEVIE